jgi:ADP-ribose pyrophosphatase YjhB (NUDIX family)
MTNDPRGHHAHAVAGHAFCPACGAQLEAGSGPGGRPACPRCGFIRYDNPKVATGVVVERDGQILLVRRNHEPMLGRWSFPSGFVDAGEAVLEAAVREVREETGVEVRINRLLGVYSRPGETVVFIAYAGVIVDGTPAPGDEAFEVGLFPPDALPELAFPHDDDILAAWRDSRGRDDRLDTSRADGDRAS